MATIGVVNYSDKSNILQQSSIENYSDESNKRQIIFLRTNTNTVPTNSDSLLTNSIASKSNKKKTNSSQSQTNKTMTRIPNPPPIAVARRNARERNRVKQVNNGFATLRQHIPTTIAAAYESGNGRGSNKKLSKVETLRMAVDYIKSLEKLLNLTEDNTQMLSNNNFTSVANNYSSVSSASPNSSPFNVSYTYSTGTDDDDLSSPRSNLRKNNYQMMYEDEENIHPLKMESMDDEILRNSNLVDANLDVTDSHNIGLLRSIDNNASLSPEVYSEHSLSPTGVDISDIKSFIPVFNVSSIQNTLPSFSQISYDRLPQVKPELLSPNVQPTIVDQDFPSKIDPERVCIITRNEIVHESDSIIDVMWWGTSQQSL